MRFARGRRAASRFSALRKRRFNGGARRRRRRGWRSSRATPRTSIFSRVSNARLLLTALRRGLRCACGLPAIKRRRAGRELELRGDGGRRACCDRRQTPCVRRRGAAATYGTHLVLRARLVRCFDFQVGAAFLRPALPAPAIALVLLFYARVALQAPTCYLCLLHAICLRLLRLPLLTLGEGCLWVKTRFGAPTSTWRFYIYHHCTCRLLPSLFLLAI